MPASVVNGITDFVGQRQQTDDINDTNATNVGMARENLAAQEKMADKQISLTKEENALQRAVAERILQIQLQGTTDASGNRVYYVPGKGFVTKLSPRDAELLKANQKNALLESTVGAERYRREAAANELTRNDARGLSKKFTSELEQPSSITPASVRAMLLRERTGAVNRAYDDSTDAAARQATRTGLSGGATTRLFDSIAKQRANAQLDATGGIDLESTEYARKANNEDRSSLINALQNTTAMSTGANAPVDSSSQLLATLANQAASQGGKAGNAGTLFQGTKNITGIQAPQLNYTQPYNPHAGGTTFALGDSVANALNSDVGKSVISGLTNMYKGAPYSAPAGSKGVDGLPWLGNQGSI
jgi:hypothetical protein